MDNVVTELVSLRGEVAELKGLILQLVKPATNLTAANNAKLITEAYATGDQAYIRKVMKKINGE